MKILFATYVLLGCLFLVADASGPRHAPSSGSSAAVSQKNVEEAAPPPQNIPTMILWIILAFLIYEYQSHPFGDPFAGVHKRAKKIKEHAEAHMVYTLPHYIHWWLKKLFEGLLAASVFFLVLDYPAIDTFDITIMSLVLVHYWVYKGTEYIAHRPCCEGWRMAGSALECALAISVVVITWLSFDNQLSNSGTQMAPIGWSVYLAWSVYSVYCSARYLQAVKSLKKVEPGFRRKAVESSLDRY